MKGDPAALPDSRHARQAETARSTSHVGQLQRPPSALRSLQRQTGQGRETKLPATVFLLVFWLIYWRHAWHPTHIENLFPDWPMPQRESPG